MAEAATRGKTKTKPESTRSAPTLPALRVRYYRRMRPQRVYSVEVNWQKGDKPPRGEKVTVRLIAAGAQVLPSEQLMDPSKPEEKATFFVTPLAKGWLRNQKLEVLLQGRKVQEIPLKTKVVTQCMTWTLLLLMFVVPWFLHTFFKNTPLEYSLQSEGIAPDGTVFKIYKKSPSISKSLDHFIRDNVPELPDQIKDAVPQVDSTLKDARFYFADTYEGLVKISRDEPLAFYAGGVLFILMLLSAWFHNEKRKKAVGKPIPLGNGTGADDE